MTTEDLFAGAERTDRAGKWIFGMVVVFSAVALIPATRPMENVLNPLLIAATAAGVVLSVAKQIFQNEGNRSLRCTQLTNAFAAPIGTPAAAGYYNNLLPPSVNRLAATTFENAMFTSAILERMLCKTRLFTSAYLLLFLLLVSFRWPTTGLLLLFTQTLFSADVLANWLRMERFRQRVVRIQGQLHQFFLQGRAANNSGLAVILLAFADYECAKDEAAMPLDSKVFRHLNPKVSKDWDEVRQSLKIP